MIGLKSALLQGTLKFMVYWMGENQRDLKKISVRTFSRYLRTSEIIIFLKIFKYDK